MLAVGANAAGYCFDDYFSDDKDKEYALRCVNNTFDLLYFVYENDRELLSSIIKVLGFSKNTVRKKTRYSKD